ncbi:pilus assembly protein [Dehalobacter sp. DCM]|uniref:TadE/TadG family type IV pilus assembly protein n=1 Tax=Dehalobacter sp. DCM TaxID=2907827 RepID=UPI003081481E|nr:pilus assembly protein [Dehalobacter sp. DCM]
MLDPEGMIPLLKQLLKKIKGNKGQAVAEFALILPILLLILGGIIDFGWIMMNQNAVDHSAREGARYAIVHAIEPNAVTNIQNYTKALTPSFISGSLVVTVTFSNTTYPREGNVTVLTSSDVSILTPIVGVFVQGDTIHLDSSCTMKVE